MYITGNKKGNSFVKSANNFVPDMDISGNIRRLLNEKQRPASWLAEKAGVTRGGLSKMLESNVYRTDTLQAIAKALGVPVSTLFGEEEREQNEKAFYQAIKLIARSLAVLLDTKAALLRLRAFDWEDKDFITGELPDYLKMLEAALNKEFTELFKGMAALNDTYDPDNLISKFGSDASKEAYQFLKAND